MTLNQTPAERLVDRQGRPYFLWDCDLDLPAFRDRLRDPDSRVRAYFLGKLLRQARPDDVFLFVAPQEIHDAWPDLEPHLGRRRRFWTWLLHAWGERGLVRQ
jgi:hypothetical protein